MSGKSYEVVLSKRQVAYVLKKSGERSTKRAFKMFMNAMIKENIDVDKMPLLINKMMDREKQGKKE